MFRTRTLAVMIAAAFTMAACSPSDQSASDQHDGARGASAANASSSNTASNDNSNPFFTQSNLPFHAPRFDKIEDSDYEPAIKKGIKKADEQVHEIANNPDDPTFQNTYVALEKSGQLLNRVMSTFSGVAGADTNDTLQKVRRDMAPKLAAHQDAIYLNDKLFARLKDVYKRRSKLDLDDESQRLIEVVYNNFVHHGANLSADDKAKLKQLNQKASKLSTQFSEKLLAAKNAGALVVDDKDALAGMSDSEIQRAADKAADHGHDGKWMIPLVNTTQQPALAELKNRDTRHELFQHSWTRAEKGGDNDTRQTVLALAKVRAKKAELMGYDNWAEWKLTDQMAKKPAHVEQLLGKLGPATVKQAKREASDIQDKIDASGKDFDLKAWDWEYYAQKVRQDKFDFSSDDVKPYFELNNVLKNGVFYAAHKLYGLTFEERDDIPVYNDDVRVFEVIDKDGKSLGLFYADYYKRDSKRGGAWMSNFVGQSTLLDQKPVIYNVTNFPKPANGKPTLLSWDQVTTMFHEFGHALHGFFADEKYPTLSGTNTARDFVEFPSQFNEYWASNRKVFQHYAKHYKTGDPMPDKLAQKMRDAAHFNAGYDMTELTEAAMLDMDWHTLGTDEIPSDVDKFEKKALKDDGMNLDYVPPRYRSSYFSHIFDNGYSAGYYAYLWTEMLADNAHEWFQNHGGLTRENGDRFRKMILSRGNTENLSDMYQDWLGHEPTIEPMLKNRGLEQDSD